MPPDLTRTQRPLSLLFCLCALALPCSAMSDPPGAATGLVDRFDSAIETGYPAVVTMPEGVELATVPRDRAGAPAARVRRDLSADLQITGRLNVALEFPGAIRGRMYTARFQGEDVVLTRIGEHLDMTWAGPDGVDVTAFSAGSGVIRKQTFRDDGSGSGDIDETVAAQRVRRATAAPPGPSSPRPGLSSAGTGFAATFFIFVHDDLHEQQTHFIHAGYVAWWFADLAKTVLPTDNLALFYATRVGWLTDMAYGQASVLDDWSHAVDLYADAVGIERKGSHDHKFLLITRDSPAPGTSGQAWQDGADAVAAFSGRYRVVAHEFGHLLGASHLAGEIVYRNWWWCESNMLATASRWRSNCYRYSDNNQRSIRAYLREGPPADGPLEKMIEPSPRLHRPRLPA